MTDNSPNTPPHHDEAGRVVVIVIGVALVVIGLGMLARQWFWPYVPFQQLWHIVRGAGWGLGLVIIGVLSILWTQRPGYKLPAKGTRIHRSRESRMVSGVLGGLAEYLSVDATLLRLAYAGLALLFGVWPAIVAYIAATIIVPEAPIGAGSAAAGPTPAAPSAEWSAAPSAPSPPPPPPPAAPSEPYAPAPVVAPAPEAPAPEAPMADPDAREAT